MGRARDVGVVLTDEAAKSLPAPTEGKPTLYRDAAAQGLILAVGKTGSRSWLFETRGAGGSRSTTKLGDVATMPISEARRRTFRAADAAEESKRALETSTKGEAASAVLARYLADKQTSADNARKYKQALRTYGWPWWSRPLADVTRREVQDHRVKVREGYFPKPPESTAKGGVRAANSVVEYYSMLASWALGTKADHAWRDHIPFHADASSTKWVIPPATWPLLADAVARWTADDRDLFWLHALLGARPRGTARMRWDRVDLERGVYHLTQDPVDCEGWKPRQSPAWDYPLDKWSIEILRERKRHAHPGAVFVFPSDLRRAAGQPISGKPLELLWKKLRAQLALPEGAVPYCTRYTRGTYAEVLFGSGHLTAILLNHQLDFGMTQTVKYTVVGEGQGVGMGFVVQAVESYSQTLRQLAGLAPHTEDRAGKITAAMAASAR